MGDGRDRVQVQNTSGVLTVDLAGEDDSLYLYGAGDLVTVRGGGNRTRDTLIYEPQLGTALIQGQLIGEEGGPGRLECKNLGPVAFEQVEQVEMGLGQWGDSFFTLDSVFPIDRTLIHGNGGNDQVVVKRVGGVTNFTPGTGQDRLVLDIPGAPANPLSSPSRSLSIPAWNCSASTTINTRKGSIGTFRPRQPGPGWAVCGCHATRGAYDRHADETRIMVGSDADSLQISEPYQRPVNVTIDGSQVALDAGLWVLDPKDFQHEGYEVDLDGLGGASDVTSVDDPQFGSFVYVAAAGESTVSVFRREASGLNCCSSSGTDSTPSTLPGHRTLS